VVDVVVAASSRAWWAPSTVARRSAKPLPDVIVPRALAPDIVPLPLGGGRLGGLGSNSAIE
jgi:hypothetical protein